MVNVDRKPNSQGRIQRDAPYTAFAGPPSHPILASGILEIVVSADKVDCGHRENRTFPGESPVMTVSFPCPWSMATLPPRRLILVDEYPSATG
jgi:hypothetical protein